LLSRVIVPRIFFNTGTLDTACIKSPNPLIVGDSIYRFSADFNPFNLFSGDCFPVPDMVESLLTGTAPQVLRVGALYRLRQQGKRI